MNVLNAARDLVRNYPGASEKLAGEMGIAGATLRQKINPNVATHSLSLEDAVEMTELAKDTVILRAWAAKENCALVPLEKVAPGESVMNLSLDETAAQGRLMELIREALGDGVVSENEARAIAAAGDRVQTILLALVAKLNNCQVKQLRAVG